MQLLQRASGAIAIVLLAGVAGCDSVTGTSEGEESGTQLALDETYDVVRNGVRLILAYDAQLNSFVGIVQNTTNQTVRRVRVEVHLSNGVELGPTTPVDLASGATSNINLPATSTSFDRWSAHPEAGEGEHD